MSMTYRASVSQKPKQPVYKTVKSEVQMFGREQVYHVEVASDQFEKQGLRQAAVGWGSDVVVIGVSCKTVVCLVGRSNRPL